MDFFGGHQRKALIQIEAHLVAKNALCPSARAVSFSNTLGVDELHKIFVLATDGAHKCLSVKNLTEFKGCHYHSVNTIVFYAVGRIDVQA